MGETEARCPVCGGLLADEGLAARGFDTSECERTYHEREEVTGSMKAEAKEITPLGGNSVGKVMPDGWYTISEAAKRVGRSPDTLRHWKELSAAGTPGYEGAAPSGFMALGRLKVGAYSEEDIVRLKKIASERYLFGRKPD